MTEMRVTGGGDASGILRLSVPPVGGKALPSAGLCAQAPRRRLTIVVQCQYRRDAWAGEGLSPSPGHTDGGTAPCPRRLPEKSPPGFCTSDRRERKRADAICIAPNAGFGGGHRSISGARRTCCGGYASRARIPKTEARRYGGVRATSA